MSHQLPAGVVRRIDVLLLTMLLLARIRIDSLAEAAVLPLRQNDVARHPVLGQLLAPQAAKLLAQQQLVDPIALLLIVLALGCWLFYLLADELLTDERRRYRVKLMVIWLIVLLTVFAPAIKLTLLRQGSGPASYSHDGGVIQTEATIEFLLRGRNPYIEDYLKTPMVEWGISEYRTALYHYPYLPWTFLFSAPFRLLADRVIGWYDQRFVYLMLFAVMLMVLPVLARDRVTRLLLVMAVGLNPIMGSDLIYGQNDSFVLAWLVLGLWCWIRHRRRAAGRVWMWGSAAAFGLACASKPTAWFLAPFYVWLVMGDDMIALWRRPLVWARRALAATWPALVIFAVVVGPYVVWSPAALIDDVWSWANGTSATAYQIWGWGASNLLLAFGWVEGRFAYWPFWIPQLILGVPVLLLLLRQQARENSAARAFWGYGILLAIFFFVSRFLNENYLGYILALLTLGALVDGDQGGVDPSKAER